MQGASAPQSIISALHSVFAEQDRWDGVVIIRGGGATSDLQAYEDYDLAAAVAQFPLPVAIGIGHERDVTVLDWVANTRLKTPTAVAEWLVSRATNVWNALIAAGNRILQYASERIAGNREQLAQTEAAPSFPWKEFRQAASSRAGRCSTWRPPVSNLTVPGLSGAGPTDSMPPKSSWRCFPPPPLWPAAIPLPASTDTPSAVWPTFSRGRCLKSLSRTALSWPIPPDFSPPYFTFYNSSTFIPIPPIMSEPEKNIKDLTYNEAFAELDGILKMMQSDQCDIDRLAALTRRATLLIAECRSRLTATDQELKTILADLQQQQ